MRPAYLLAFFYLELSGGAASARRVARVPLPPPRPADLTPRKPAPLPLPEPGISAPAPAPDASCPRVLASKTLVVVAAPPVTGPNGCGIATPVALSAVVLADGTKVPFEPPSLIRCDLAETLGTWFREDVAPAVQSAGGLAKILGSNGYECRTRNHIAGAKLSEHAKGNALDLRGLVLRNGETIMFEKDAQQKPAVLARLRATACARFRTVLGPGADVFHEAHLHVDLEQRHHDFRMCEWTIALPVQGPKMPVQSPKMPVEGAKMPETRSAIDVRKPRP